MTIDPRSVPCPRCKAHRWQRCIVSATRAPLTGYHEARTDAAQAAAELTGTAALAPTVRLQILFGGRRDAPRTATGSSSAMDGPSTGRRAEKSSGATRRGCPRASAPVPARPAVSSASDSSEAPEEITCRLIPASGQALVTGRDARRALGVAGLRVMPGSMSTGWLIDVRDLAQLKAAAAALGRTVHLPSTTGIPHRPMQEAPDPAEGIGV